MSVVTCDDLRRLIGPHADRVAVLILLRDAEGKPNGEIQFVAYGKTARDKAEAHRLKEWVKREVFGGDPPAPDRVHESFVLDAAKNKEALDALRDEARAVLRQLDDLATAWGDEGVFRRCRDRLRAAVGGEVAGEGATP